MYHPAVGSQKPCAVVICNPLGFEAIRAHRSIRHLADQLSSAGFPTLRFDYHGTGDSAGADEDPDRVEAWLGSLEAAIREMERVTAGRPVCLVGIRMGATLAALAAARRPVSHLVLWEPCLTGAAFTREMAIVASASLRALLGGNGRRGTDSTAIEAGGYSLTAETQKHLARLTLLDAEPVGRPEILIIGRDDLREDRRLVSAYVELGLECAYRRLPGHPQMMAGPRESLVPSVIHDTIGGWLSERVNGQTTPDPPGSPDLARTLSTDAGADATSVVHESPMWFGPEQRLFGILTRPGRSSDPEQPAVILVPGGAVPRTSATRIYVRLARRLAEEGLTVLRMDVSGIGDSLAHPGARENDPYPPALLGDVRAAMSALSEGLRSPRPIHLLGLCSGAFAAFATALESTQVCGVTLINPLAFQAPGDETPNTPSFHYFRDAAHYRTALLDPASWSRLLRGKVDIRRVAATSLRYLRSRTAARRRAGPGGAPESGLASDLRRLAQRGTRIRVAFSHGDPGYHALMRPAGDTVRDLVSEGHMTMRVFERTDHVFSPSAAREELIDWILEAQPHHTTSATNIPASNTRCCT